MTAAMRGQLALLDRERRRLERQRKAAQRKADQIEAAMERLAARRNRLLSEIAASENRSST